jgi:8-oxo-dGTP diphosphatase
MWYRMSSKKKVSLVILFDGDKVLLGEKDSGFELPGGHSKINESEEDCAKREFLEETGISVKNLDPFRTMDMPNKVISVFVCKDFSGNLEPGSDLSDALWLDVHNLPKLKYNGAELILKAYKKSS